MTPPFPSCTFSDPELLRRACTVPRPNLDADNQRLEFLGDAVLQILVSERLFAAHPTRDEGDLTQLRSALVSGKALLQKAKALNLDALLRQYNPDTPRPEKTLVDALEALFGALWLDGGRPAAEALLQTVYSDAEFADTSALRTGSVSSDNPKGALATCAQKRNLPLPVYTLLAVDGPSHAPRFRCSVSCDGRSAEGTGTTRKAAEAQAAAALLHILKV